MVGIALRIREERTLPPCNRLSSRGTQEQCCSSDPPRTGQERDRRLYISWIVCTPYTQSGHLQIRSTNSTYQDLPVAGSMSPVKITEREGFFRFSSKRAGKDSTSRTTVKEYLNVTGVPGLLPLSHFKQIINDYGFGNSKTSQALPIVFVDWTHQSSTVRLCVIVPLGDAFVVPELRLL